MNNTSLEPLLIVEDSDDDFAALQRVMKRIAIENPIYRCADGDQVLDFLYRSGEYKTVFAPRPSVILLDLNLPGTDGREVLEQVKQDQVLKEIPIVVFTTSNSPTDIEYCYQQGANGYLVKPMDIGEFQEIMQAFADFWLKANCLPPEDRER
jgi:CheY-like chemotaxis protein